MRGPSAAVEFTPTIWMSMREAATPGVEDQLVRATLSGDRDAFGELVRRHERHVFRLAGRFFRRPEDVEDVAQETFLAAWRKLSSYRGQAPLEHWLTRICLNCCYERLRRRGARTAPLSDDAPIAAAAPDPTARIEVQRLLDRLQPADRFILQLLDGEGWTVAEIAERLGWTAVNVKVRAHRARRRLRRILEEDEP